MKVFEALQAVVMGIFSSAVAIIWMGTMLAISLAISFLPIAGIVLLTLFLVHAGPWAPEQCTGELVQYTSSDFSYSIDYPKCWHFEQINDNEISIKPKDSNYTRIEIGAYHEEPMIGSVPESLYATIMEVGIELFYGELDCTNVNIYINEPASGKWDWVTAYTVTCDGMQLEGQSLIKETQSTAYNLAVGHAAGVDWPEGQDVVNSFSIENFHPQSTPTLATLPSQYQNSEYGYAIRYPKDWNLVTNNYEKVIIDSYAIPEFAIITLEAGNLYNEFSIEGIADYCISLMKTERAIVWEDFEVIYNHSLTGKWDWVVGYTYTEILVANQECSGELYFARNTDYTYIVEWSGTDSQTEICQLIVDSFDITY